MRNRMPSGAGGFRPGAAAAASILTIVTTMTLTGCSLREETAPSTSATDTTSSVPPPRAEASAAPTPLPSTDRIPPVGPTWLATEDIEGLGTIVVDASGRTLYTFARDTADKSTCYDACADTWLPLLSAGDPAGGIGIDVAAVHTVARRDGSSQVSYQGHPLYRYAGDTAPGQVNGNGLEVFGGVWRVLDLDADGS